MFGPYMSLRSDSRVYILIEPITKAECVQLLRVVSKSVNINMEEKKMWDKGFGVHDTSNNGR
jgi:hypothetical protein